MCLNRPLLLLLDTLICVSSGHPVIKCEIWWKDDRIPQIVHATSTPVIAMTKIYPQCRKSDSPPPPRILLINMWPWWRDLPIKAPKTDNAPCVRIYQHTVKQCLQWYTFIFCEIGFQRFLVSSVISQSCLFSLQYNWHFTVRWALLNIHFLDERWSWQPVECSTSCYQPQERFSDLFPGNCRKWDQGRHSTWWRYANTEHLSSTG